jgi:4-amino-4-deoxy-L-arabinose transferase-like glycosyltransferase
VTATPFPLRLKQRFQTNAGPLLIAILFITLVGLVNPLHNFPMSDDWEYARTAQTLLATGRFERSPLVQATAFFPALWGALFSAVFGLTFTALRLSTLPLGLGTVLAFYGLLGELDFDPARRLLGALTFMAGPLFVFLTHSFMTDMPFLFWLMLGLWLSLRALRLKRVSLAFWGSLCAALAFLTRQLGLALPLAFTLVILIHRPRSDWPRWLAAITALPIFAAVLFYSWQSLSGQTTWADAAITGSGTLQFLLRPQTPLELARRVVIIAVTLSLYLAPLWVAALPALPDAWRALGRSGRRRQIILLGLTLFLFGSSLYFGARGEWWPYLNDSVTKAGLRPFLAHYGYVYGDRRPPFFPQPVWIGFTLVGAACAVVLGAIAITRAAPTLLQRTDPKLHLLLLYTLTLTLPTLLFALFYERYILPFIPIAIILLLDAMRRVRLSLWSGAVGLLVMGVFSIALMWDYWGWHEVRWAAAEKLVAEGVSLDHVDGGNEWDGWYLSSEAYAYIRAHDVPMTTNPWEYVIDPDYMITFTAVPGYHVEKEISFFNPFRARGEDKILLLKRETQP